MLIIGIRKRGINWFANTHKKTYDVAHKPKEEKTNNDKNSFHSVNVFMGKAK